MKIEAQTKRNGFLIKKNVYSKKLSKSKEIDIKNVSQHKGGRTTF